MTRLLTPHIATMTELREPHKVFARAKGQPDGDPEKLRGRGLPDPAELAHPESGRSVAPRLQLLRRPLRSPQRPKDLNTEEIGQIIIRCAKG